MKLRHKFFAAIIITSFLIIALMVGIMQIFIYKNFAQFVNNTELEKMDTLIENLAAHYQENNGWQSLNKNPLLWENFLSQANPDKIGGRKPRPTPPFMNGLNMSKRPLNNSHGPPPFRRHQDPIDPLDLNFRLCLFDDKKNHVAGIFNQEDRFTFREIVISTEKTDHPPGHIIGFLGLKIINKIRNPLGIKYLSSQTNAFYTMGTCILVLAAIISYLLSRHLLAPVKELMKGTKALRSYDFDIDINVTSKDELGDLADDFNHMTRKLKQYERLRKNWISDISHELRTPMSVLRSKLEAVQDGIRIMNPEMVDSLHSDVLRLTKLVDELHSLSMADSKNLSMIKMVVNPVILVEETLETFRIQLEQQQIRVEKNFSKNQDIHVSGDTAHLSRLFSNLIENSLRYTDSPGLLKISIKKHENNVVFIFEDSAPAVPDNSFNRIFDRLFRVDKSRSRKFGGSGLGLSICKQIVEDHHGSIMADLSVLGGLKIIIQLPLKI
ncbi:MAG: hypothetical protein A2277_21210 [Desulfobacterales bacterium RIFOXYA12_FULL_46_15]|nr:MAG: hypothetical protein A2097_05540 [Desulfobacula sp. GWF2_41_7]OGR27833.1 MAG: hypothetical protein A2277_21210 [Desulfobacterales bacterium RIFOXYA12_FULL_46_15]